MDFLNKHLPNLILKKIPDTIPRKESEKIKKLGIVSQTYRPAAQDYEYFDDFKIALALWNQENFSYVGDKAKEESNKIFKMINDRDKKIKSATYINFREK